MTYKRTYNVNNNQLFIQLPDEFKNHRKVTVIVESPQSDRVAKLKMLKLAQNDPLFLEDIDNIMSDFKYTDSESI
jgi:hypothetical protein